MLVVKRKKNGQWEKGFSGNPGKGRPKKDQSLIEFIRAKLKELCPYDAKQRTWFEALADAEMRYALTDTAARSDLFNRLVGKAKEEVELTGELMHSIVFTIGKGYQDGNSKPS